jgi:hypothetical protein
VTDRLTHARMATARGVAAARVSTLTDIDAAIAAPDPERTHG